MKDVCIPVLAEEIVQPVHKYSFYCTNNLQGVCIPAVGAKCKQEQIQILCVK